MIHFSSVSIQELVDTFNSDIPVLIDRIHLLFFQVNKTIYDCLHYHSVIGGLHQFEVLKFSCHHHHNLIMYPF
jgi:hypothetical protein